MRRTRQLHAPDASDAASGGQPSRRALWTASVARRTRSPPASATVSQRTLATRLTPDADVTRPARPSDAQAQRLLSAPGRQRVGRWPSVRRFVAQRPVRNLQDSLSVSRPARPPASDASAPDASGQLQHSETSSFRRLRRAVADPTQTTCLRCQPQLVDHS